MHRDTGYPLEVFIEQWSHDRLGLGYGNFRERLYQYLESEMGIARTRSHKILNDVLSKWALAYLSYFPVETDRKRESALWFFLRTLVAKLVLVPEQQADTEENPLSLWETALSELSESDKREVQRYSVDWNQIKDAREEISKFLPRETVDWLFSDLYDLEPNSDAKSTPQKYEKLMQEQLTNLLFGAITE